MKNGEKWLDIDGKPIEAHGGCLLKHQGKTYWYGENRTENNYVSCYVKVENGWKFLNNILTTKSPTLATRVQNANLSLINESGGKINLERPKVIYNEKTHKFVLWAHYENGEHYKVAGAAVASCDTPDGDFTYHGSFNPFGEMSRDCTLFVDNDKTYFVSAARENADLIFYTLAEDYLNVSRIVNRTFSNEQREAPAFIKKHGKYLLVTSACTGWKPNQSTFSVADDLEGDWSVNRNLGDENTYFSQSAFLYENENGDIVYFGDRWGGNSFNETEVFDYNNSGYCAYKIEFDGETAKLIYSDEAFV